MKFLSSCKNQSITLPIFLASILLTLTACMSPEADSPITVSAMELGGSSILIQNVAIFDSEQLRVIPNQDVLLEGTTIASIGPSSSVAPPAGAHILSGEGATLVPGLIDMHGHISTTTGPSWEIAMPNPDDNMRAYVYAGITTVFDPGDSSSEAFSRRELVASGELLGPRIFTAGKIITDPEGHPRAMVDALAPWWIRWFLKPTVATGVATAQEAIAAVDERVDAGASAIKVVVDSIPLEATIMPATVLRALVDQSHKRGVRTVAHIGTTADAIMAAENGVDLLVHSVYKELIPEASIQQLVDFNIPIVSTSEVFDRYGRALKGPMQPTALEEEMISPAKLASFYPPPDDFDLGALRGWIELMQATREVRLSNIGRLHQAGATILAGSDTQSGVFPGAGLHRELVTLVASGLTPAEAIRAATLSSAKYLAGKAEPDSGSIAPGKRADLILVNGDPTKNIAALSDIREVILNGSLLERKHN